jgi:hypothetical protein
MRDRPSQKSQTDIANPANAARINGDESLQTVPLGPDACSRSVDMDSKMATMCFSAVTSEAGGQRRAANDTRPSGRRRAA